MYIHLHTYLYIHLCIYKERKEGRWRKNPPKYAAWLVDSASPSLRRSFPTSPGVEQWAGELSNMKFLLLDVLMILGGRSTLMTVCSSSCTSGCSSHGLSEGQSSGKGSGKKSKSRGRLSTSDTEQPSSLSNSKLEMRVFALKAQLLLRTSVPGTVCSMVSIQGVVFLAKFPDSHFNCLSFFCSNTHNVQYLHLT